MFDFYNNIMYQPEGMQVNTHSILNSFKGHRMAFLT